MRGSIGVTLIACCFALTPLVGIPADLHGTLALSDTSRVSVYPELTQTGDSVDLGTFPRAELVFPGRRSAFSIGYGPQLTLHDVTRESPELLVLHTAHASYSYSWRHTQFSLGESATYGTQNFANLGFLAPNVAATPQPAPGAMAPPTGQPGQLLPQQPSLLVFSSFTSAGVTTTPNRRETLGASVSYGVSGGFGEEAQQFLPQQRTETISGFFTYALSRRDSLATNVSGSHSVVDPTGLEYWTVSESESWRHAFTPSLAGTLGAGVAEVWTRTDHGWRLTLSPTASVSLSGAIYSYRRRRFSIAVSFGLGLTPVINPITGVIQETLGASSSVVVRQDHTTIAGLLTASQTFPTNDPAAARFVGAGVIATQEVSKRVDLFAGYFTAVQVSDSARLSLPRQWNAFAGITVRAPLLTF